MNRFHSPEVIGGGMEIEYRNTGFSVGVLSFANNSTENPLQMGTVQEKEFYSGFGISQMAEIFVKVPEESSSLIGLKVQVLGEPNKALAPGHKLSFTLGMGSERDDFDSTFKISLKSDVTDYSIIHGYRFSPNLMIYEGVSISNYHFQGTISGATGLDSDEIDYQAKNILGAHLGLILGGETLKLKGEYAVQKIEWSHTESKLFQSFGFTLSMTW